KVQQTLEFRDPLPVPTSLYGRVPHRTIRFRIVLMKYRVLSNSCWYHRGEVGIDQRCEFLMMQDNHRLRLRLCNVLEYRVWQKLTIVNKKRMIRARTAFEEIRKLFQSGAVRR